MFSISPYYREVREDGISIPTFAVYKRGYRHTYLNGVWACNSYTEEIEKELCADFTARRNLSWESEKFLRQIEACESVSVHVRRGDFAKNGCFTVGQSYFANASRMIRAELGDDLTFFIFSDEMEWARQHVLRDKNRVFVDCNDSSRAFDDFILMTKCKHHIISSSTFSWWAAKLACLKTGTDGKKVVVAPTSWFQDHMHYSDLDIYPRNWLKAEIGG